MPNLFSTKFNFTLPIGLPDVQGRIDRDGIMRLATGLDEIQVQKDPLVREDPEYGILVRFSKTIDQLGQLAPVPPEQLEQLFLKDFFYLLDFYNSINSTGMEEFGAGE